MLAILEVVDTAILLVPSPVPRPVKDLQAHLRELRIPAAMLRLVQDKPSGLDGMAGIDGATCHRVDKLTVRPHRLQDRLVFRVNEILAQLRDRLVDLSRQDRIVNRLPDAGGRVDQDHAEGVSLRHQSLSELRLRRARGILVAQDHLEQLDRLLRIALVAGSQRVMRHSDRREGLREEITTFPDGNAIRRDLEKHTTILVKAILLYEVNAAFAGLQPRLVPLDVVVCVGQHERKPALEPNRFGCIHQITRPVQTGKITTVLLVQAILHPEWHDML